MDTQTEARIVAASQDFMGGAIDAGELLDRTASALWGEGSEAMAQTYEALPGGDGGAWVGEPAARHLQPVAPNGHAGHTMKMPVRTKDIALGGEWDGWTLTVRRNAPLDVVLRLQGLATDEGSLAGLIATLPDIIIRWNFVDEQGAPLPLTAEGCRQLPLDLFRAVMEGFGEVIAASAEVPPR